MNTYIYSDPHFGHHGVCKFMNQDGSKMRPFVTIEEMDEALVERFNEVVQENDTCYFLGDVAINRRGLPTLARLNCKNLYLIKGNHDEFRLDEYTPYFKDILSCKVINNVLFSHIPVHPSCLVRWSGNVHGHLHTERVLKEVDSKMVIDERYYNASVEQTDFYPILLSDVLAYFKK